MFILIIIFTKICGSKINQHLLVTCSPGHDIPALGDLYINVIPQYAAHWEALGAILGLKDYEIAVISKDNPNRSTDGCATMLMKWLQSIYQPTWGKLDDAINLLRQSPTVSVCDVIQCAGRFH